MARGCTRCLTTASPASILSRILLPPKILKTSFLTLTEFKLQSRLASLSSRRQQSRHLGMQATIRKNQENVHGHHGPQIAWSPWSMGAENRSRVAARQLCAHQLLISLIFFFYACWECHASQHYKTAGKPQAIEWPAATSFFRLADLRKHYAHPHEKQTHTGQEWLNQRLLRRKQS